MGESTRLHIEACHHVTKSGWYAVNNETSGLPRIAEKLLRWLGAPDYIVGDFVEEFEEMAVRNGRFQANQSL